MKRLPLVLMFVLVLTSLPTLSARTQSADEVVEKYLAALGGRPALAKLTSRKGVGTVTIGTPNGDLPGTIETYSKAPNKSRALLTLDLSAFGASEMMTLDQRFDGTTGWALSPMQGDQQITGNQLENMKNNSFPSPLLTYKETGTKVELLPQETVGGKTYIVLQIAPKTGSASKAYINPATYLIERMVAKVTVPDAGEVEQTSELSDYRVVDGVQVPFVVFNSSPLQSVRITLKTVEHNIALDDAMFSVK